MRIVALLLVISQGVICLLLAPLTIGTLRTVKARLQRREGPPLFQPYRDLRKLLGKAPVLPEEASWLFGTVPAVVFACYASLGFLAPMVFLGRDRVPGISDLLILVCLLGLARLMLGLGGMAAGAPFGGLGSSRELFLHVLAEPALIMIVCTLALQWHTTNLTEIVGQQYAAGPLIYANPALLLLLLSLLLVILAEAGRLPFDNPTSHLELTMFGKAIHLEYSGPHLALLEWAEWARLTFLLTLLVNLFAPWLMAVSGQSGWESIVLVALYPLKLLFLAGMLAVWESLQVKMRLRGIVTPALTALALSLIAAALVITRGQLGR
jgi:formate hydrogenlyase subunit 4